MRTDRGLMDRASNDDLVQWWSVVLGTACHSGGWSEVEEGVESRAAVTKQFEPATVPGLGFEWLFLRSLKSKWQGRWWCFPLLALWLKLSRGYKMNQYLRCSWLPTVGLSHRFLHTLWQPVQGSGRGDGCSGLYWGGEADLIVLCHLVPQSHPSHTILCANPELAHRGRG